jgi:acyl-CoA reductase-like NAD-dependent aldehyde dehydrogenase
MDPNTTLGPLCIKAALELVDKQIQMAVDGGAKVPMGGKRLDRRGYFLDPTILTDITPEKSGIPCGILRPGCAGLPSGGVKNSGYGRELSDMGISEFVKKKLIRVV